MIRSEEQHRNKKCAEKYIHHGVIVNVDERLKLSRSRINEKIHSFKSNQQLQNAYQAEFRIL